MSNLKDKTGLLTGASSGIGEAIALSLAEHGVRLALVGRNAERLERVAAAARRHTAEVRTYTAEFAKADDVDRLAADIARDFPNLNMLIHCAGVLRVGRIEATPPEVFDELFRVNVLAPYALTRHFVPALLRSKGDIVFINSRTGLTTKVESVPYSATKHALRSFADGLRGELHKQGVRIMSVYPGRVATPMQEYMHTAREQTYVPSTWTPPEAVAQAVVNALLMPDNVELPDITVRGHNDTAL